MKKNYVLILSILFSISSFSQFMYSGFEDLSLPIDTFWNGSNGSGHFVSNTVRYTNSYDTAWGGSWSGISYSTMRDTSTAGFGNQYSCIAGKGAGSSSTYAVVYPNSKNLVYFTSPSFYSGIWVNNSTYAYLSMKNGDSFAKKFGDSTNASGLIDGTNGKDWFLLTIYGSNPNDSVEFYLADFRGPDSTDYIIKDWTYISFPGFSGVNSDSLRFKLTSSDNGTWGMNTPNYFCMDSLKFRPNLYSINENSKIGVSIFPNPTNDIVNLNFDRTINKGMYKVIDIKGRELENGTINGLNTMRLDLSNQTSGIYFVVVTEENQVISKRIIKQ